VDGNGRAPCNGCVSKEGQCRWEEVKDDLLFMAQELEDTGSTNNKIRFQLYRQYNFLTHGSGTTALRNLLAARNTSRKNTPMKPTRASRRRNDVY
jgi:hypothetical protein